jgi:UDP-N-acetylmuramoyl-L-alanyl-D-glutamate--2,6-diaminopimelate ligase
MKKLAPKELLEQVKPYGHLVEAMLMQAKAGFPAKKLKVIGVTGTDGKTTTCNLIMHMLRSSGKKVAMITTISVDYGDEKGEQVNPSGLTTPGATMLATMLKRIVANDVEWLVIETGSHALAQNRVWGLPFSVAVMTNMSHEHLDYHKTFDRYRDAKRRLFKLCARNKKGLQVGVINADDATAPYFIADTVNPITYGLKAGDLQAHNVETTPEGSRFAALIQDEQYNITCNLPGAFNVYNSLAAAAVGRAIGLNKEQIEKGIATLQKVPGRMERIVAGQPFEVVVDYAVTPKALETVLQDAKALAKGKVILVFGATGDRDKLKRPIMGEIAARLADRVFLTDDETYTEDPATIRHAVYQGIKQANGAEKTKVVDDRQEAIIQAFKEAKKGDVVLLTGIGHQTSRNMGGHKESWDERAIAHELLKSQANIP